MDRIFRRPCEGWRARKSPEPPRSRAGGRAKGEPLGTAISDETRAAARLKTRAVGYPSPRHLSPFCAGCGRLFTHPHRFFSIARSDVSPINAWRPATSTLRSVAGSRGSAKRPGNTKASSPASWGILRSCRLHSFLFTGTANRDHASVRGEREDSSRAREFDGRQRQRC